MEQEHRKTDWAWLSKKVFLDNVYRDYSKIKGSTYIKSLGQGVCVSQQLENELKLYLLRNANMRINDTPYLRYPLDKKSINELIQKLEEIRPLDNLKTKLINVAKCRNWLVHSSCLEMDVKLYKYDKSQTELDRLFFSIINATDLISSNDLERLKVELSKPRVTKSGLGMFTMTKGLTFDEIKFTDYPDTTDEKGMLRVSKSINSHRDWVELKIIITTHLMYEFIDYLNGNQASIYSN